MATTNPRITWLSDVEVRPSFQAIYDRLAVTARTSRFTGILLWEPEEKPRLIAVGPVCSWDDIVQFALVKSHNVAQYAQPVVCFANGSKIAEIKGQA